MRTATRTASVNMEQWGSMASASCQVSSRQTSCNNILTNQGCGDSYLDLNFEVCDGGMGCDSDCFCKPDYVPTVPPSIACVPLLPTYLPGWFISPDGDGDQDSFLNTFGFISIILFVLFVVMLAGCVAGTVVLIVIMMRRRRARRRQQFFNQNIEMEPKTSAPGAWSWC